MTDDDKTTTTVGIIRSLTDTLENNPLTFYHIKLSFMTFKHMLFETKSLEENTRRLTKWFDGFDFMKESQTY